jgi:unsaturated chondroitin disaccharide hydrolase
VPPTAHRLAGGLVGLLALGLAACGTTAPTPAGASPRAARSGPIIVAALPLHPGLTVAPLTLPAAGWDVSFDARLRPGTSLTVGLGTEARRLRALSPGRLQVSSPGGPAQTVTRPGGWRGGGWWHIEATPSAAAIDGRRLAPAGGRAEPLGGRAGPLRLTATAGSPLVQALIATPADDPGLLLLHRVAELHARIPPRRYPVGATPSDRIVYDNSYWTTGFWAGALWQAAAIAPAGGMFARWALSETLGHLGQEHTPTHDVGFEYGQSSLAGWEALCHPRRTTSAAICARLRASGLAAADELVTLAAGNPVAGTIPTSAVGPVADTIIDSMMNIQLLPWASRQTGDPRYRRVAARHAAVVARLLVRRDGSTAQAVNFDRATGRILSIGTHQGLSDSSTWSRGQGWAVYGFSQAAIALHSRALLSIALRTAGYVARHLPASGVPLWDYDAPPGAPVDVSAGVITADGMFHLARACQLLGRPCASGARWRELGTRMLDGSLRYARTVPPLGFLGSEVLNEHGRGCWCDGGELSFGLSYALEGVRLTRTG